MNLYSHSAFSFKIVVSAYYIHIYILNTRCWYSILLRMYPLMCLTGLFYSRTRIYKYYVCIKRVIHIFVAMRRTLGTILLKNRTSQCTTSKQLHAAPSSATDGDGSTGWAVRVRTALPLLLKLPFLQVILHGWGKRFFVRQNGRSK